MKLLRLRNDYRFALVDNDDFDRVSPFRWSVNEPYPGVFYARATVAGRDVFLHRFIAGLAGMEGQTIDHRNRFGLDCRRANLRPATYSQNATNRVARPGAAGIHGVHRHRDGWHVKLRRDGRTLSFGVYPDIEQARLVAEKAVAEVHGEFAPPRL